MARHLSLDWIDDLRAATADSAGLRAAAIGQHIAITEQITGGPEGAVTYHVVVDDGEVSVGAGPADPADVVFTQDHATAVAIATGRLNAQEAFIGGRLRIVGDMERLIACQPVFAALDAVFATVRARTDYGEPVEQAEPVEA
jgi:putative sterol carrier protein